MATVYRATDASLGRPVAIKLLDERLASDENIRQRFTREAHTAARLSGEPGCLPPEQAEGPPATPASDRYALGIVAFELLAGTRPYETENPTAEALAHVNAPVPALSKRAANIPPEVDAVIERALAKDPAQR